MMQAWDVWLNDEKYTTVYFDKDMSMPEVKKSLINHDGFSAAIIIKKQGTNYTIRNDYFGL